MNIGIIGLGFMGSTHLKAYSRIPEAEVVAVADSVPKRLTGDLSDIQGNIGGPGGKYDFSQVRTYSTPEALIADPAVEAVDVCLPTNLHHAITVAALRAGKHVLVEKPMALSGEECDEMIDAAKKARRVLMVAQVLRFFPDYRAARDVLRSGALGPLRSAIFHRKCAAPEWGGWMKDATQSGGGIFDLLIHDFDFCCQVFGPPKAVVAVGPEEMERGVDWVLAHLEYPHRAPVVISGGWHHPRSYPFSMDFTIVMEGGTLDYHSSFRPLTLYRADGTEEKLKLPEMDGYEAEIRYFLKCARANRWPKECRPQDSALAVRAALAMHESRRQGGKKIRVRKAAGPRKARAKTAPHAIKPMEIGVMLWGGGDPRRTVQNVKSLGVNCGQIGLPGDMDLSATSAQAWRAALEEEGLTLITVFSAYKGESYADVEAVKNTVGFIPAATRAEREARTLEASDFAAALGVGSLATHIGFVPHDRTAPDYIAVREMVRRACDRCAANKQTFALETGQEPAATLKQFIADVDRPNLRINFDPANMIMYGTGDPIEALEIVKEHVISVHCKDGEWPATPGALGVERPLGQGAVGIERFVAKLKEIGYANALTIEREIHGEEQRRDILAAIQLLEGLR